MARPRTTAFGHMPIGHVLLAAFVLLGPGITFGWLAANPERDRLFIMASEHFMVVTVVALLAVGVALLVIRVALRMEQYQVLLVALGYTCLAGFFAVHAVATPGIFASVPPVSSAGGFQAAPSGGRAASSGAGGYDEGYGSSSTNPVPSAQYPSATDSYGAMTVARAVGASGASPPHLHAGNGLPYDYGGTIVGLSAYLSVASASVFFAASYAPFASRLKRRLPLSAGGLALAVVLCLMGFGLVSGWQTQIVADLPLSRAPYSYGMAAISAGLLGFAAWNQLRLHLKSGFPMQFALAMSFVLLAEAQVIMITSVFWSMSWWGYHILMLMAVCLALGALFLELDRRRGLERFLPAEVVERVVSGDFLRLNGERRIVTVLFADLRNSTSLAEHLSAAEVVELLNAYVGALARSVFLHGGMLDKFLGDGLMAVFGILDDASDGADAAIGAALEMRKAVTIVNASREVRGLPIAFGVGIHTGEVILGAIGLPNRSDFTAIGDAVNTTARLEQLCKQFHVDIVASDDVIRRLTNKTLSVRSLGSTAIRGREQPVEVFTLA